MFLRKAKDPEVQIGGDSSPLKYRAIV